MHSRRILSAAWIACLALGASPGLGAPEPEDKCEARKLRATGTYAACRLKAKAKAELKSKVPDYTRCDAAFAKRFAKAEEKAGVGVCPTDGDAAMIQGAIAACAVEVGSLLAADDACPPVDPGRHPLVVVGELRDAIAAADWEAVACSFHPDAVAINDQGILVGRAEIVDNLMDFAAIFGSTTVVENVGFGDVARILFVADGGWVHIDDGVETYVVRAGRIGEQTTHGLLRFSGPPPD